MKLFGKKKKSKEEEELEEEEDDEEKPAKKPSARKFKDLNPENSKRRKAPPKPWTGKERLLVFGVFSVMTASALVLAGSARNWKLPGRNQIALPDVGFEKTYVVENPNPIQRKDYTSVKNEIYELVRPLSGIYGVYVWDIEAQQGFGVNEHEVMQAASLIKLPVMLGILKHAEEGKLSLSTVYTLQEGDKIGGAGSLYARPAGYKLTYRQLVEYMGQQSDNTAFGIARKILGTEKINQLIAESGMKNTSLAENETTPYEIGLFFRKLWDRQLVSEGSRDELLDYLTNTIYEDWIPASIEESNVKVAHKYGRELHVINDAGIVFAHNPYILVVMTDGIVESETALAFPKIVQLVHSFITSN